METLLGILRMSMYLFGSFSIGFCVFLGSFEFTSIAVSSVSLFSEVINLLFSFGNECKFDVLFEREKFGCRLKNRGALIVRCF